MNFATSFRTALLSATLLFSALSQAQDTKGIVVNIKPTRVESVASMMRRQAANPIKPKNIKETEVTGVDRSGLPQNPLSPQDPFGPNDQPRSDSSDTKRALKGGLGIIGSEGKGGTPLPFFSQQTSFDGSTQSLVPYTPPDTMGDVSPTQVLVTVNGWIRVLDREGNIGALNMSIDTFFGTSMSDPRCRYDRLTNRWFIVMIDLATPVNNIRVAVSNGPTITNQSSFTFYTIRSAPAATASQFWDYPTLGIDQNGLYIGGNLFANSSGGFSGTTVIAINKANLLAGTATVTFFGGLLISNVGPLTPQPCDNDDPAATVALVLGVDRSQFGLIQFRKITFSGGAFTISGNIPVTVSATSYAINPSLPGGGTIDALQDRIFGAKLLFDKTTGVRSIWTAHSIGVNTSGTTTSPTRSAVRWYQFDNLTGTPTVTNFGTIFDSAASNFVHYTIPTITSTLQGHSLAGFSRTGTTNEPGVSSAFRLSGSTFTTPVVNQAGTPGATYNRQRWGDYSHTIVDPYDGMSVWTFQEYLKGSNNYAVRVIKLLAPVPTISTSSIGSVTQGSSLSSSIAGTGLFDPGAGYTGRLAASVSGTGVSVSSINWVSPTQVDITVAATPSASPGVRTVTVTNPDGQTATTNVTVAASNLTISGTIALSSWSGPITSPVITIEIRNNATDALLQTNNVNLGAGGTFSISTPLPAGTYKLRVKGVNRFLSRIQTGVVFSATGISGLVFSLLNGDVNGDNIVGPTDLLQIRSAYGATPSSANWNANADLNGDGIVGPTDLLIVRGTYGQSGQN